MQRSLASTPNVTPPARRMSNERPQRLLEVGFERSGAAQPHEVLVARRIEDLDTGRLDELLPQVGAEAPDVAAALEVVVDGRQGAGRLAVRREPAPGADDERQVLDADRALRLARAARRALPQHLRVEDVGELRLEPAGEQRRFVLEDQRLRVERLAGGVRRTVHLAAAALDAGEGVEHLLPFDVRHGFEPDLLLLEIQVRHRPEDRRTQVDRQGRQHEMEMLRIRDEDQEAEDHERMDPPVDAGRQAGFSTGRRAGT